MSRKFLQEICTTVFPLTRTTRFFSCFSSYSQNCTESVNPESRYQCRHISISRYKLIRTKGEGNWPPAVTRPGDPGCGPEVPLLLASVRRLSNTPRAEASPSDKQTRRDRTAGAIEDVLPTQIRHHVRRYCRDTPRGCCTTNTTNRNITLQNAGNRIASI